MKKLGLGEASTFSGFCAEHDSELFRPIDAQDLIPTDEQMALYAYRCLCRELFVRQTAIASVEVLGREVKHSLRVTPSDIPIGLRHGLASLCHHKSLFDSSLKEQAAEEFEWVAFTSRSPWTHQLSGVLYPNFDWQGRTIQKLLRTDRPLQLLTFFTAPIAEGWALALAWHRSSRSACYQLLDSLKDALRAGIRLEDALFRLTACSENQVVRISWWESLPLESRNSLCARFQLLASPLDGVPSDYLMTGLEGISPWTFDAVLEWQKKSSTFSSQPGA